jgi:stage II sporulation protein D
MPKLKKRSYNNNLEIHIKWGRIQAINKVNLEPYISGVVEAEGGANAGIEYYKIQAVLARTYALGHLDRHTGEGFHLCDGVHCQAFNGLSARNIQIIEATKATAGVVAIDTDSILITAAFHANCGGQTESSEKVWLINKSYLRPVQDPYCQNQRSFNWEKSLTLKEWTDYLIKNKFKVNNTTPPSYYNYTQIHRQLWYIVKSDSLLLTKIRADLNLRSTFFSVSVDKQKVIIKGHGFGHGVGLCQDGAIQMAKLNYNYQDILKFYFQNISTISYLDVPKVKNPSLMLMEY